VGSAASAEAAAPGAAKAPLAAAAVARWDQRRGKKYGPSSGATTAGIPRAQGWHCLFAKGGVRLHRHDRCSPSHFGALLLCLPRSSQPQPSLSTTRNQRLEAILPSWARLRVLDTSRPLSDQCADAKARTRLGRRLVVVLAVESQGSPTCTHRLRAPTEGRKPGQTQGQTLLPLPRTPLPQVLIPTTGRVDAAAIEAARGLRLIAQPAAGYANIDIDAAKRRGVPVTIAPGVCTGAGQGHMGGIQGHIGVGRVHMRVGLVILSAAEQRRRTMGNACTASCDMCGYGLACWCPCWLPPSAPPPPGL
jgi:hypothetical protein